MFITFIIYKLHFTLIDYILHVFLHTSYGKTTIFGRSHIYHHKYPEQVNWLGNPPNLYIYIMIITHLMKLYHCFLKIHFFTLTYYTSQFIIYYINLYPYQS